MLLTRLKVWCKNQNTNLLQRVLNYVLDLGKHILVPIDKHYMHIYTLEFAVSNFDNYFCVCSMLDNYTDMRYAVSKDLTKTRTEIEKG